MLPVLIHKVANVQIEKEYAAPFLLIAIAVINSLALKHRMICSITEKFHQKLFALGLSGIVPFGPIIGVVMVVPYTQDFNLTIADNIPAILSF